VGTTKVREFLPPVLLSRVFFFLFVLVKGGLLWDV
jgi:hypothetical protein